MRDIYQTLVSVRTGVWLLVALSVCMGVGAVVMPARPATYAGINNELLFDWLMKDGRGADNAWFWGALVALGALTLQTVVCSLDALFRLGNRGQVVLRISPHLMHLGFLLILLGHLLSAGWGFRAGGMLPQGGAGRLPDGSTVVLTSLDMRMDPTGFPRDWWADVSLRRDGTRIAEGRLSANRPLFHDGVGIYLKNLNMTRRGLAADLVVNRDPGTLWVLAGAVLFTIGNILLLALKIRREAPA